MSRFVKDYTISKSAAELQNLVGSFMAKEGFTQYHYNGGVVWKKGLGLVTGPQFMVFAISENKIHLEAWIKFALLPGVYFGEMGTEGIFGLIPKKLLKKKIEDLERHMYQ
jgi:hypothetical protein